MRRSVLLLALVSSAFMARAAQPVTVEQLEQFLAQQQAAHVNDADLAQKLAEVELSEQLTEFRLDRLKAELKLGDKTATRLNLLADLSAFLGPPASEIPAKTPPDATAAQEMIHEAQNFATVALKRLPDFLATRRTRSFEDIPIETGDSATQSGMHAIGGLVQEIAYRNGLEFTREAAAAPEAGGPPKASLPGLSSAGEFGPVLATILSDSAHGTIEWSHWEQNSIGAIAVFRYEVPKESSNYQIDLCCAKDPDTKELVSYHGKPAYRGFISVNPATGDVLRLTLEAEIEDFDPAQRFGLLVSYGVVEIAGKSLICPLRSAVTLRSTWVAHKRVWNEIRVNDSAFSAYRRFGSTARVLPNATTNK